MARPPSRGPVMRPNTGYRRLDTGASYQHGQGVPSIGQNTKVNVTARPITQHGMTGIKTKTMGPKRRVADRSYYESMLRDKTRAITDETNKLNAEVQQMQKADSERVHLDRKKEEITHEVRELEGRLADFNLALDKARTSTDVSDLQHVCKEIQEKNAHEKKQIDALFLEKHQVEQQLSGANERIEALHKEAEGKLARLGPRKQEEYREISQKQIKVLEEQLAERERGHAELEHRLKEAQAELRKDEYQIHMRAMDLQNEIRELETRGKEMAEETNPNRTPEDIRGEIRARAQTENRILSETQQQIREINDEIDDMNDRVQAKEREVSEMKEYQKKSHKYEALYQRDAKITHSLEKVFPEELAKATSETEDIQRRIISILEHISSRMQGKSGGRAGEMDPLAFKGMQIQTAENTLVHVQEKLAKSKEELAKVENLDKKIAQETKDMDENTQKMLKELKFFEEVNIQERATKLKVELLNKKYVAQRRKTNMEEQVHLAASLLEERQAELFKKEAWTNLVRLETNLRNLAQNVFKIENGLISKRQESDYRSLMAQVLNTTEELNALYAANEV